MSQLSNRDRFLAGEPFGYGTVRQKVYKYKKLDHNTEVIEVLDQPYCKVHSIDEHRFTAANSLFGRANGAIIPFQKLIF